MEGFSLPEKRTDWLVLEANTEYWDTSRFPRVQRITFDNTLNQKDAVELVKTTEGRVDLVTELRPLDTLRVAESPFAQVVKNRGSLLAVAGWFNMRQAGSRWGDIRLRQAVNLAINRQDLIHYATRGNGVIIPGIVATQSFGYNHDLAPYPFDPDKARHLFREAGYPEGFALTLIASADLEVQATVVSKMLEQAGLQVDLQLLDSATYNRKTDLRFLDQPPEHQTWDIALGLFADPRNFPIYTYYARALGGSNDWVTEQPTLRQLYEQTLHTVDREKQQAFIRQMERHTSEQAYFLFLYNAIQLYAVNKAVAFVPYVNTRLNLVETTVTEYHWSVRKQKTAGQE